MHSAQTRDDSWDTFRNFQQLRGWQIKGTITEGWVGGFRYFVYFKILLSISKSFMVLVYGMKTLVQLMIVSWPCVVLSQLFNCGIIRRLKTIVSAKNESPALSHLNPHKYFQRHLFANREPFPYCNMLMSKTLNLNKILFEHFSFPVAWTIFVILQGD